jgi:hypothetical protein
VIRAPRRKHRNNLPPDGSGANELCSKNPTKIQFFRAKRSRKEAFSELGKYAFLCRETAMGTRGTKIRKAIAHLACDGCDLTDRSVQANLRADDARFYLGYLEEDCGFQLSIPEVIAVARAMMRGGGGGGARNGAADAAPDKTPAHSRHFYN